MKKSLFEVITLDVKAVVAVRYNLVKPSLRTNTISDLKNNIGVECTTRGFGNLS